MPAERRIAMSALGMTAAAVVTVALWLHHAGLLAVFVQWTPRVWHAFAANIGIGLAAMTVAVTLGVILGFLKVRHPSGMLAQVTDALRNLPWLATIFFAVYVLPFDIAIAGRQFELSPAAKTIIGIGIPASGYVAEVTRGAIAAIGRGLFESAAALGLSPRHVAWHVTLPLALRGMVPGLINLLCAILLATSLGSVVGVEEVFTILHDLVTVEARTDIAFWAYLYAMLLFFAAITPLVMLARRLERRWALA